MIRMIVAVLVTINLVLYFWTLKQHEHEQSLLPVVGGDLKLLSEAKKTELIPEPPEAVPPKPVEPKAAEVKPSPVVKEPQPKKEPPPPKPQVEKVIEKVVEKVPPKPLKPIATTAEIETKPPVPVQQRPQTVCYTYGPINNRLAAVGIQAWMKEKTTKPTVRRVGVNKIQGYRVLIEGAKSEQEAIEQEQRLKTAGITDIWRITRGENKNAISMGLFSHKTNATRRAAQAVSKGFKAKIDVKKLAKERFWVDFSSPKHRLSTKELGLVPGPGQTLKYRPCTASNKTQP